MSSYARGEQFWAKVYDQRFCVDTWYDENDPYGRSASGQWKAGIGFNGANQGLDGDHIIAEFSVPGTLARLPYTLARNPDIVLLHIGTNDINSGIDADAVIARLKQNLALIRNAGKWAIVSTIYPRSTSGRWAWPAGHRKWKNRQAVNSFITSLKGQDGIIVFDPNAGLTDRNAPSGEEEWLPGFASDGVHPDPRAAQVAGQQLAALLAGVIQPGSLIEADPSKSNLLPDALLSGSDGTKSAGISGDVASKWNVFLSGPSTVHCTKEGASGSPAKQVIAITPTAAPAEEGTLKYDSVTFGHPDIALNSAGLSSGDWFQFGAYLEVSAWEGWVAHACQVSQRQDKAVQWISYAGKPGNRNAETMPHTGFNGWWFSDPVRVVDNTDRLRPGLVAIEVLRGVPGTGTIKISRPFLRKVADPRPGWNL